MKGMEISLWYGVIAPAKTSSAIIQRLNAELQTILKMSDVQSSFAKQGATTMFGSPQDYAAFMQAELQRWGQPAWRAHFAINNNRGEAVDACQIYSEVKPLALIGPAHLTISLATNFAR